MVLFTEITRLEFRCLQINGLPALVMGTIHILGALPQISDWTVLR